MDKLTRTVLQVALKILTRGRLTVLSPLLEKRLSETFGLDVADVPITIPCDYFKVASNPKRDDIWLDSPMEEYFYWEVLPKLLGSSFRHMTLPQVLFASLVRGDGVDAAILSQRVDFLITTPDKQIIVELNGPDHDAHAARDEARARLLTAAGYEIIFIQNDEVQSGVGANLQRLYDLVADFDMNDDSSPGGSGPLLGCLNLAHQLQVSLLYALLIGQLTTNAVVVLDESSLSMPADKLGRVLKFSMEDLQEMVLHLSNIYDARLSLHNMRVRLGSKRVRTGDLFITYSDDLHPTIPTICVQQISFGGTVALEEETSMVPSVTHITEEDVTYFLHYLFGHQQLREGQYEAVYRALTGKDAIVLLPTGHGKSAAFQLASMLMPGVTVVIDPIISLIDDQLDNLRRIGIDRAIGISSQIEDPNLRNDIINAFGQGQYMFCYIAPERFQTNEFRNSVRALTVSKPVALIAIDEAHCISEWGHDFRTAYLNIGRTSREYCRSQDDRIPPLLALTGTASHAVLRDVKRELQIEEFDAIITPTTFNRDELHFAVFSVPSGEKFNLLRGLLQRWLPEKFNRDLQSFFEPRGEGTCSGLVFCPHINGPFGVTEISSRLSNELQRPVGMYSGGEPKNWSRAERWVEYKKATAHAFKSNLFPLLSATKAYGMGIDKPNIRYTVHYNIPPSIVSFYQEAGRAGRDRQHAECCVIFSNDFPSRTERLLSPQATPGQIARVMREERDWNSDDDITRLMFFHARAFRGIDHELTEIAHVIEMIGDICLPRKCNLVVNDMTRQDVEKAIHRLLVLGVIRDYTIDYAASEFSIFLSGSTKEQIVDTYSQYVQGYNKGRVRLERDKLFQHLSEEPYTFVRSACRILIEFSYDTIERGRRRGLGEMLELCEKARPGESDRIVRERILRYLETTYSREIEDVLSEKERFDRLIQLVDGIVEISTGEVLGGIRSPRDAQELRGQVARYLESYPDHPGLLTLRAVAEVHCFDCTVSTVLDNLHAATNFAIERYKVEARIIADLIAWALGKVYERRPDYYGAVATDFFYHRDDPELTRLILASSNLEHEMILEPGLFLIGKLCNKLASELYERKTLNG